ncbi:hypothetical protein M436DRAFT_64442 [Aureobasidium namibiae CBS 147.97]|uniref:Mid2 domain-containing protein n=1 Tax=Aureobasidium namibiae CBS 147.97 TaxID=1043004 RepID=A0A074XCT1_9PEZI|nr:uncharacterized protein M436DRAFT_64442 [Aureobasidium namibiae CBS 147.97]KEQ72436.1 hypothetical protein M436DRAFT_64442 [Aureobasidium namibiae CBS 147.97]
MRSSLRGMRGRFIVIVPILVILSPLPQANAQYFIHSLSIGESLCNSDVVAGTMISVAWTVDNISVTGNDTCWLAIRPTWNTVDDNAYVNGVHIKCSFTSTNINIPLTPFDKDLPFNGSTYSVRLISPAPNNIMLDSCPFSIQAQGWQPPLSESDRLAQQANVLANQANQATRTSTIIGGLGLAVALLAAFLGAYLAHYLQQRRPRPVALSNVCRRARRQKSMVSTVQQDPGVMTQWFDV